MSAHTIGPWRVSSAKPTKTRGIDILAGYSLCVANVPVPPAYMTEHPEYDNARLIAAAPDLLEAAQDALWVLTNLAAILPAVAVKSTLTDPTPKLRAAIAKATGQ